MQTSNIAELRKITYYVNIKRTEMNWFVALLRKEKLVSKTVYIFLYLNLHINIYTYLKISGQNNKLPENVNN